MILKSVLSILQGMGTGARGVRNPTVTTVAGTNNITLTPNAPLNCGYVRVQAKGFTTGGGFTSLSLRGTDGTNTWAIAAVAGPAGTAGDWVSLMIPFITDVPLTSIAAVLVLAAAGTGGTPQLDAEVWGALM